MPEVGGDADAGDIYDRQSRILQLESDDLRQFFPDRLRHTLCPMLIHTKPARTRFTSTRRSLPPAPARAAKPFHARPTVKPARRAPGRRTQSRPRAPRVATNPDSRSPPPRR